MLLNRLRRTPFRRLRKPSMLLSQRTQLCKQLLRLKKLMMSKRRLNKQELNSRLPKKKDKKC